MGSRLPGFVTVAHNMWGPVEGLQANADGAHCKVHTFDKQQAALKCLQTSQKHYEWGEGEVLVWEEFHASACDRIFDVGEAVSIN